MKKKYLHITYKTTKLRENLMKKKLTNHDDDKNKIIEKL